MTTPDRHQRRAGNHVLAQGFGDCGRGRLSVSVSQCLLGANSPIMWPWPPLLKQPAAAGSGPPDRCVVALLALEGFLLLSAWFRWFPFNEHKGWTVLIAVASVGATLLLMFLWFLAALVFRLRFQFSILALLLLVVVVAVPCSWLATEMKAAREQRVVVEWIEQLGRRGSMIMSSMHWSTHAPNNPPRLAVQVVGRRPVRGRGTR